MNLQFKYFLLVFISAVSLNLYCSTAHLDYLSTLIVGMILPAIIALVAGFKNLDALSIKVIVLFELLFTIPVTIVIEKVMLYYNSWGFSKEHIRFIGINIFGAPVEEYVYWWCAPLLVGIVYMIMRKLKGFDEPPKFIEEAVKLLAEKLSKATQGSTTADRTDYIEDHSDVTKERPGLYSTAGETKFPTWVWMQVLTIATIMWLKHYFKGSWLTVMLSTGIFVAVALIGERHAIDMGFWSYNRNRMVGVFFFNVPIEEYIMYFTSAMSECLILDIAYRKFKKT